MDLFAGGNEEEELPDRPADCGVLSFHAGTEDALLLFVESAVDAPRSPEAVLAAVDEFCETRHWMMCIGNEKGAIVRRAVAAVRARTTGPLRVCELGAYVGYSAVLLASELGSEGSVLSLEVDPSACRWARRLVNLAGLTGRIEICQADAADIAHEVRRRSWSAVDVLLVDHEKCRYLRDLQAAEPVLADGAVVIADNITCFDSGASMRDYLDHVRRFGPYKESVFHPASVEYSRGALEDGVEVSILSRR